MRVFLIVNGQRKGLLQGSPRREQGDRSEKQEYGFWRSLDHLVASRSYQRARDHDHSQKIIAGRSWPEFLLDR
jgi:hypothetical protein